MSNEMAEAVAARKFHFTDDQRVLDHGYVRYIGHMGDDATVIEAARMSTGKGFVDWEADAKLLEYLYKNKHSTPFEMCELALEVQAPIMVFREWHRSRTQSYSEFSARYAQMLDLHYIPEPSRIQKQSTANKQGSAEPVSPNTAERVILKFQREQQEVYDNYDGLVKEGIAKEIARINTPVSRYSKMRVKTDLRNWLWFLNLRMRQNAQYEIRQFADAVARVIEALWPRTYVLFLEHDLHAVTFSRTEVEVLKKLLAVEDGVFETFVGIKGVPDEVFASLKKKLAP